MNVGFPYYWYGVDALSTDTVIISGFNNQGPINTGAVRWTSTEVQHGLSNSQFQVTKTISFSSP